MKRPKPLSVLEETFALQVRALRLPVPEREYRFHKTRKFLFDFCWPEEMLAVEVDGGTRSFGRHNRHDGYEKDCLKMALAILDGWRVYRFTGDQVKKGVAIDFVEKEFKKAESGT